MVCASAHVEGGGRLGDPAVPGLPVPGLCCSWALCAQATASVRQARRLLQVRCSGLHLPYIYLWEADAFTPCAGSVVLVRAHLPAPAALELCGVDVLGAFELPLREALQGGGGEVRQPQSGHTARGAGRLCICLIAPFTAY